jgi:hypothetical protein
MCEDAPCCGCCSFESTLHPSDLEDTFVRSSRFLWQDEEDERETLEEDEE